MFPYSRAYAILLRVKLIVNLKLQPTKEQAFALRSTLIVANQACNWISQRAWETQSFRQYHLHKLSYRMARATFDLSAQMVVRCIAKVTDAYKLDKKRARTFRKYGAISYDERIISFKADSVSLWTAGGRCAIPFVCGEYQRKLLPNRRGEVDLIYRKGEFYLNAVCELDEPEVHPAPDILGVDFGVINIVTDSDGQTFSGAELERTRQKYSVRRQTLQRKASAQRRGGKRPRSVRRLCKRLSGREANFKRHENHCISKQLVGKAQDSTRGLAIEDLTHIRKRTRFRRPQRSRMSSWSFAQLRQFLTYKARLAGVPLTLVDPRDTSRTCSACGHCAKENRKSQSEFVCVSCGHSLNADFNAAINIRGRAVVNLLQVSEQRQAA
ncbi:MAG TPA: transposase [Pyrinomonadaceae bacterium]